MKLERPRQLSWLVALPQAVLRPLPPLCRLAGPLTTSCCCLWKLPRKQFLLLMETEEHGLRCLIHHKLQLRQLGLRFSGLATMGHRATLQLRTLEITRSDPFVLTEVLRLPAILGTLPQVR